MTENKQAILRRHLASMTMQFLCLSFTSLFPVINASKHQTKANKCIR